MFYVLLLLQVFEDLHTYMKSLDVILSLNATLIYPGHGPIVQDPQSHVISYVENRNRRELQIVTALSSNVTQEGLTAMDLVHIIYIVSWA